MNFLTIWLTHFKNIGPYKKISTELEYQSQNLFIIKVFYNLASFFNFCYTLTSWDVDGSIFCWNGFCTLVAHRQFANIWRNHHQIYESFYYQRDGTVKFVLYVWWRLILSDLSSWLTKTYFKSPLNTNSLLIFCFCFQNIHLGLPNTIVVHIENLY